MVFGSACARKTVATYCSGGVWRAAGVSLLDMLPQRGRLRRRAEFQRAYEQGQRIATPGFLLYLYSRVDEQPSRIGFVVGKRFGSIATRNRLKRRLRATCRPLWDRMKPGYDLVFVARNGLVEMTPGELQHQIETLLQKEGILASVLEKNTEGH